MIQTALLRRLPRSLWLSITMAIGIILASASLLPVSAQTTAAANQYLGQSGRTRQQLQAQQLRVDAIQTNSKLQPPPANFKPECPASLHCIYRPAAYQTDSSAPFDYGNYALADRPNDSTINQVIIHETEGSLSSAIANFQDPTSYVSVQYIIDTDGSVYQTVPLKDIAYQAGNFYTNMHSVGIEHVGYSEQKGITAAQYQSSATLTKWLAGRYHFALNRTNVIGHDSVPGPVDSLVAGMHWDPGPYWDWNYYMHLLGVAAPTERPTATTTAITIYPDYTANQQALQNCTNDPCTPVAALPTNFLPLYSSPSANAQLLSDPYLQPNGSAGTTAQNDWGDQAPTGFSYVVAGHQPGWTAIWFAGQKAWFKDNGRVTRVAHTIVITPKANKAIPVYGQPVPEDSAPAWQQIPASLRESQMPLTKYTIQPGQSYALDRAVPDDFNETCANVSCTYQGDGTIVVGKTKYAQIEYNHRLAYVNVADVSYNYLTY